jgi:hypothetical protein
VLLCVGVGGGVIVGVNVDENEDDSDTDSVPDGVGVKVTESEVDVEIVRGRVFVGGGVMVAVRVAEVVSDADSDANADRVGVGGGVMVAVIEADTVTDPLADPVPLGNGERVPVASAVSLAETERSEAETVKSRENEPDRDGSSESDAVGFVSVMRRLFVMVPLVFVDVKSLENDCVRVRFLPNTHFFFIDFSHLSYKASAPQCDPPLLWCEPPSNQSRDTSSSATATAQRCQAIIAMLVMKRVF